MNLTHVLFSPNGRIGQQEYWIGILIIVAGNIVGNFIPFLGFIISLGLIYVGVCVYGKRLHDFGKSAWIHGLIWLIQIILGIVGFVIAGGAIMAAVANGGGDEAALMAAIGASGGLFLMFGLGFLIWIVYTVWVGISAGDPNDNRFGPAGGNVAEVFAPEPTAPAAPQAPAEPPAETPSGEDADKKS